MYGQARHAFIVRVRGLAVPSGITEAGLSIIEVAAWRRAGVLISRAYDSIHLAVARMGMSSSRLGLALVVGALSLSAQAAHAQAPTTYWIPDLPFGFGGNLPAGPGPNFGSSRYNFPNGWFIGRDGGGIGLNLNGANQDGAFGRSLDYQGVRVGYDFRNGGGLPLTFYAGFDTLKYNAGIGGPFGSFNTVSGSLPGYKAHAGVEFQPTPNVSLSLGLGFTQQSGSIDSNTNSPSLYGAAPFADRGLR
jgi:opacity protein-like surface antigen